MAVLCAKVPTVKVTSTVPKNGGRLSVILGQPDNVITSGWDMFLLL